MCAVEWRVPFDEVDDSHPWVGREPPHRMEEVFHGHPSGSCARSPWELGAVDHVDITVDHERVAVRDMVKRSVNRCADAFSPDVTHSDDEVSRRKRILVHRLRICEAREADLGDIGSGQPVLEKRSNRIAIAKTLNELSHVKVRIESDEANIFKLGAERQHARSGDRIVSAEDEDKRMGPKAGNLLPDPRRCLFNAKGGQFHVAMVGHSRLEFATGFDIIASNAPKGFS